jgi:hypothetical protein
MIRGATEGHIYIQDPLCYTSGIVLIKLRCVERKLRESERMKGKETESNLSEGAGKRGASRV